MKPQPQSHFAKSRRRPLPVPFLLLPNEEIKILPYPPPKQLIVENVDVQVQSRLGQNKALHDNLIYACYKWDESLFSLAVEYPLIFDQVYLQQWIMCYRCVVLIISTFIRMIINFVQLLVNTIRLLLFVVCLLPGFIQFAYFYWFVADRTVVQYGKLSRRQALDVYAVPLPASTSEHSSACRLTQSFLAHHHHPVPPNNSSALRPVVVFVPGGAWLIGYKMWGALSARAWTACGMLVVVPDYRNYPWTSVPGMVDDITQALQWTRDHVSDFGGDPSNIVVVGQSAGGHLILTALLRQALSLGHPPQPTSPHEENLNENNWEEEIGNKNEDNVEQSVLGLRPWLASDFKGLITLSAPLDLTAMTKTFGEHGLDKHIVDRIFGTDSASFDPRSLLEIEEQEESGEEQITHSSYIPLPPMQVYHGDADKTVPLCYEVCDLLQQRLIHSFSTTIYPGWSHTDAIIEGPMMANHSFHRDVFDAVVNWTSSSRINDGGDSISTPPMERTIPLIPPFEPQHEPLPSFSERIMTIINSKSSTPFSGDPVASDADATQLKWPDPSHHALRPLCPRCLVQLGRAFMPF